MFSSHIKTAEARGAAEQRRKDAKGQKPVAWRWRAVPYSSGPDSPWPGTYSPWYLSENDPFPEGIETPIKEREVFPLYTHPANVAALEARIAELEGERERLKREIQAMRPGSVRPVIHSPTRFMDDTRAALTRGRTDTDRINWLGMQDIVVGEHASYGRWKDVVLSRYQRSLPADLTDIRHSIDTAMDMEERG